MAGRCECCNNPLSYKDSTARFKTEPGEPLRYVGMCGECRSFLPPKVEIVLRSDLPDETDDEQISDGDVHEAGWDSDDE